MDCVFTVHERHRCWMKKISSMSLCNYLNLGALHLDMDMEIYELLCGTELRLNNGSIQCQTPLPLSLFLAELVG